MSSTLTDAPEVVRAALLRYVRGKCGADAVADLVPVLGTAEIAQSLHPTKAETLASLRRRARLAREVSEAPVVTQDGRTWPLPRDRMTFVAAIVARMADDIRAIARGEQDGVVETGHLIALGWTAEQIRTCGRAATRRATDAQALEEAA